ncbi:MAG: hypothetical protein MJ252_07090 [archaeon]|nr:hypothetical protein [archaeon]
MWNKYSLTDACSNKDRFYQYQRFCERIMLTKGTLKKSTPPEYEFLKVRGAKKQKERGK